MYQHLIMFKIHHLYNKPDSTALDDIYSMFCITSDYYFVGPQYSSGASRTRNISKIGFARHECANCKLTSTRKKPDFRVNLKLHEL